MESRGRAASWLPILPASPSCARVCYLHRAYRQLRERRVFPALYLKFLLESIYYVCLVFSPRAPAWSWCWTETTVGLFGLIEKIPDTAVQCLPGHTAEGRLPHANQLPGQGCHIPYWPLDGGFCRSHNETSDETPSVWINRSSGVISDGGLEEMQFPCSHFNNMSLNLLPARKSISHHYKVRMSRQK